MCIYAFMHLWMYVSRLIWHSVHIRRKGQPFYHIYCTNQNSHTQVCQQETLQAGSSTGMCLHLCASWRPNLSPYFCVANTLLTKKSPPPSDRFNFPKTVRSQIQQDRETEAVWRFSNWSLSSLFEEPKLILWSPQKDSLDAVERLCGDGRKGENHPTRPQLHIMCVYILTHLVGERKLQQLYFTVTFYFSLLLLLL